MSGAEPSDEALAAQARTGNLRAFEALVTRHQGTLHRFALRSTGSAEDARDLVQASFVAAWEALGRYDPRRPFLPWLRRILLNRCRDWGRRAAVRRLALKAFAEEPDLPPSDGAATAREGRLAALERAVADLPELHRTPLLLTLEGLSQAEISEVLGTTQKAVEMRVRRAKARLSQVLGAETGEG